MYLSRGLDYFHIGLLYFIGQLVGTPLPLVGAELGRRYSPKVGVYIFMLLSGLGIATMGLGNSLDHLVSYLLYQSFLGALPCYYFLMSGRGRGTISLIWAVSIIPSVAVPAVGGGIVTDLGFRSLFLLAGIFLSASALPVMFLDDGSQSPEGYVPKRGMLLYSLTVLPVALAFPFIYLLTDVTFSLPYYELGVLSSASEVIGMLSLLTLPRLKRIDPLPLSLMVFSLSFISLYNPLGLLPFGLWEAVIPFSLEKVSEYNSLKALAYVNTLQSAGWSLGYGLSLFFPGRLSIEVSSVIALSLSLGLWVMSRGKSNLFPRG